MLHNRSEVTSLRRKRAPATFSLPREQKVIKVSQMQDGSLRMDNFGKPTKPGYFTKVQKEVDFPLLDVQTK